MIDFIAMSLLFDCYSKHNANMSPTPWGGRSFSTEKQDELGTNKSEYDLFIENQRILIEFCPFFPVGNVWMNFQHRRYLNDFTSEFIESQIRFVQPSSFLFFPYSNGLLLERSRLFSWASTYCNNEFSAKDTEDRCRLLFLFGEEEGTSWQTCGKSTMSSIMICYVGLDVCVGSWFDLGKLWCRWVHYFDRLICVVVMECLTMKEGQG